MKANVQKKVLKRKLDKFKKNKLRKPEKVDEPQVKLSDEDFESDDDLEVSASQSKNVEEPQVKKSKSDENKNNQKSESKTDTAALPKNVLTDVKFSDYEDRLDARLLKAVKSMGFEHLTEIQAKCIDPLLQVRLSFHLYILTCLFRDTMCSDLQRLVVAKPWHSFFQPSSYS